MTKIDLSRDGMIGIRAEGLAKDLPGDGRDLLHEAICRALTSRQCRETATVDQFLRGIMRSIASTARRSRERRGEHHVGYPVEDLVERMALGGYVAQSAEDIIETERVRTLCADVLEQLAAASKTQAALIEGIGLDLRGQDLADHLGITLSELGTVRRGLKRNVQRIWPKVEAFINPRNIGYNN